MIASSRTEPAFTAHMLCYEFGLDRSREEEKEVRARKREGREREMGDRRGSEHPCPRVDHIAEFTITHTRASLADHIVHISIITLVLLFFLSYI